MEYITQNLPVFHVKDHFRDMGAIAKKNNARIARGDAPVVIVGHQPDNDDEKPAVGILKNFKAGMRNGVPTLFADVSIRKDRESLFTDFPRRSIEIFQDGIVSGLALLGGNAPACDLGTLYSDARPRLKYRKTQKKYTYEINSDMDETQTATPSPLSPEEQMIMNVLQKTDVYAWAKAQMQAQAIAPPEAPAPAEEAPPQEQPMEEPGNEPDGDEAPAEDAGDEQPEELDSEEPKDEEDYKQKFKTLARKYRRSEREKHLMSLLHEGYSFDLNDELDDTLTDKQFDKQISRIKRNYKKAPINVQFKAPRINSELSESEMDKIRDEAIAKGISYRQAKEKYIKGA